MAEMLGEMLGTVAATYFNLETGVSTVSVFCEQKFDAQATRAAVTAGLERIKKCDIKTDPGTVEIGKVRREDWAESWKKHFHPMEIGKALLIKPSWSQKKPRKKQSVVILDPGLSFGTGQHPTTSFCLGEIVRCHKGGKKMSFLDIGTGSGILAIAAAKLGYKPVEAFDFDPEAVRVARENVRKNRVGAKIKLKRGDVTRLPMKASKRFDLVCANLISNLLIAEKQRIVNRLQPDGTLVLAGILAGEFAQVSKAFADLGLTVISQQVEGEWCSGAFCFS